MYITVCLYVNIFVYAPIAVLNSNQFDRLPVNPTFTQQNYVLILRNSTFFSCNYYGVNGMKFQFYVGNTMKFIWKYKKRKCKNNGVFFSTKKMSPSYKVY